MGDDMARYKMLIGGALALALATGACNRNAKETRKDGQDRRAGRRQAHCNFGTS
jgi:hypothetical protein